MQKAKETKAQIDAVRSQRYVEKWEIMLNKVQKKVEPRSEASTLTLMELSKVPPKKWEDKHFRAARRQKDLIAGLDKPSRMAYSNAYRAAENYKNSRAFRYVFMSHTFQDFTKQLKS